MRHGGTLPSAKSLASARRASITAIWLLGLQCDQFNFIRDDGLPCNQLIQRLRIDLPTVAALAKVRSQRGICPRCALPPQRAKWRRDQRQHMRRELGLVALSFLGLHVANRSRSDKIGGPHARQGTRFEAPDDWPAGADAGGCTSRCRCPVAWLQLQRHSARGRRFATHLRAASPSRRACRRPHWSPRAASPIRIWSMGDSMGASSDTLRRLTIASIGSKAVGHAPP